MTSNTAVFRDDILNLRPYQVRDQGTSGPRKPNYKIAMIRAMVVVSIGFYLWDWCRWQIARTFYLDIPLEPGKEFVMTMIRDYRYNPGVLLALLVKMYWQLICDIISHVLIGGVFWMLGQTVPVVRAL